MELQVKYTLTPEKWIDLYAKKLFSYTYMRISDRDAAEDLVSETFLSALRSKDSFKGDSSEKTWLYAILKRRIIDYYRKNGAKKTVTFSQLSPFSKDERDYESWIDSRIPQPVDNDADFQVDNDEFFITLEHCMSQLPQKQSVVFRMKSFDEMDSEKICEVLEITPSNYWVLMHRARLQLRECLEKNWFHLT